jgi:hypothetical protein
MESPAGHEGDRNYKEGEVREGTRAELGHLEGKTLELIETPKTEKAAPSPKNKAEGAAPANKAAKRRK